MTKIEEISVFPKPFEAKLLTDSADRDQLTYAVTEAKEQIHGDATVTIDEFHKEAAVKADSFISQLSGNYVGIRAADCGAVLLADPVTGSYAAVHSGWRGSQQNILIKTIAKMQEVFDVKPEDLIAWVGPLACAQDYEVGPEFRELFKPKYLIERNGRLYLDNRELLTDQLLETGVKKVNISQDERCTLTDTSLPSARRQKQPSGNGQRMLVVITRVD